MIYGGASSVACTDVEGLTQCPTHPSRMNEGNSKQKSARIANAAARGKSSAGRKGGQSGSYEDWSVPELKKRAKEIGLSGYSRLNKRQLVSKLRNS